ncbi:MAG TPA: hypothetical protein VMB79_12040 [Jatrophihabitans sp.]|nr:hypothetical protein [Jatrophihabitans sp.]
MPYTQANLEQKYGPTPVYGLCEAEECSAKARTTCHGCGGDFCLGHAPHSDHADG